MDEFHSGTFQGRVPGREDFSDFAFVLENGHQLKCHKFKLAEVSPVFCAMFKKTCVETELYVKDFELDTVTSFLDYVYSGLEIVPAKGIQKKFDKKNLTPELMKFSHAYRVSDLLRECIQHIRENINDDNVVGIWSAADLTGNKELKKVALNYLGRKQGKLMDVPGLKESIQSPQFVKSLINHLSDKMAPPCEEFIIVNVTCTLPGNDLLTLTRQIQMKKCYTIKFLRFLIDESLEGAPPVKGCFNIHDRPMGYYRCLAMSLKLPGSSIFLDEKRTLGYYDLSNKCRVECSLFRVAHTNISNFQSQANNPSYFL